ncbi:pap2 superfamily phosphatase [Stylonychia lemnae]|uniref:Pap2 superfamily phosphatase n=1 Tax=Stylonychia lemnae TaxID=5949 RepID=A0A078ATX1_STYLE|nr:pap2 superfamily phosphatase [Stylonychia lemnae]|eukprot:CDW85396.1 pap2 superfamily phosphatase [Stylonychia lemnae]
MQNFQYRIILTLFFTVTILIIVGVHFAYRDPLFEVSQDIIEELQSHNSDVVRYFLEGVSLLLGGEALMFGTCALMFAFAKRQRAFYYILLISIVTIVLSIGKLAYHHPRPYMVDEKIKVYGCATEFGDPSGHTTSSSAVLVALNMDFLSKYNRIKLIWKILSIILCILLIFMVGFSRLYNGDHTIDQIIYGWCLGIWVAVVLFLAFKDKLYQHISEIMNKPRLFNMRQRIRYAGIAFGIFIILIIGLIVSYEVVKRNFDIPQEWKDNLAKECGADIGLYSFDSASLIQGLSIVVALSSYYGILYGSMRSSTRDEFYLYGDLWWQGVLRLLVFLVFSAIFVIPVALKVDVNNNAYLTALVTTFVPFIIIGFVVFSSLFDKVYYKLKLSYLKPSLYFKGDRYDMVINQNETISVGTSSDAKTKNYL